MMTRASSVISPLMRELSEYISSALARPLPPEVAERAKHHVLDMLAAMVSGSRLPPGKKAISYVKTLGGTKEACVIGTRFVTSATDAALANGMLAHADETDDTYYAALVHPGCSVVPAALAMAERERRGGEALLRAVVLGYDVCARTTQALRPEPFRSAGHSTHSFGGTLGSAAATGALAGLDARRARYLLSYAAQHASGLSCWARDTEHIEKAFDFGGMPARNGVAAATMVAAGCTAVEDVFSGERNFFFAYGDGARPERLAEGLGSEFEIMNTAIKRWPVGYPIQAPLDALATLVAEHRVRASDVAKVMVTVDEQGARTVNQRAMPDINLQHLAAVMLIDGKMTFASSHDAKRVRDPAVLRLKKRIELTGSAALSRAATTQAIVEITTRGGGKLRHHTRAVRGSAANPMSREEVAAKSRDLLAPVLGAGRAEALIDGIWNAERVVDVRKLRALLRT